jgi:hypothetical protein
MLRSARGKDFIFEKFLRDEINTDILTVIGEGVHNHHPKGIVVLGYDIK